MKKFICALSLLLISMVAMATVQIKAPSPPGPMNGYDNVATLSTDGMAVISFYQMQNIVACPTPVMLNQEVSEMSVRVIDAYQIPTEMGDVSMMLVSYRWPSSKSKTLNPKHNKPKFTCPIRAVEIPNFATTRTDIL